MQTAEAATAFGDETVGFDLDAGTFRSGDRTPLGLAREARMNRILKELYAPFMCVYVHIYNQLFE